MSTPKHKISGPKQDATPTCWWNTCGYLCAQTGHRMGIGWGKVAMAGLLSGVDQGQAERFWGKVVLHTGGFCGKVSPQGLAHLGALRRGPDLGRCLPPFGVGVLEHGQGTLDLVLEDAFENVDLAFHVDERRLQLVHVDRAGELKVELVQG